MNQYFEGKRVMMRTTEPFTDNLTGEPIDPTVVLVTYSIDGNPQVTYRYGVGDQVVRTTTGDYYYEFDTSGLAGSSVAWMILGDPDGTDELQVCQALDARTFEVLPLPNGPAGGLLIPTGPTAS